MTPPPPDWCCTARQHFVLAIIGTVGDPPADIADFITQWEPQMVVSIVYCPFCGKRVQPGAPRRVSAPRKPQ